MKWPPRQDLGDSLVKGNIQDPQQKERKNMTSNQRAKGRVRTIHSLWNMSQLWQHGHNASDCCNNASSLWNTKDKGKAKARTRRARTPMTRKDQKGPERQRQSSRISRRPLDERKNPKPRQDHLSWNRFDASQGLVVQFLKTFPTRHRIWSLEKVQRKHTM